MNSTRSINKLSILLILCAVIAPFFLGTKHASAVRNSAYGTFSDTTPFCYYAAKEVARGFLPEGGAFVTIEYGVFGNDYARRFVDSSGNVLTENGYFVSSDNCSQMRSDNYYWDGRVINPNSTVYTGLFTSVAGDSYLPRADEIYLGAIGTLTSDLLDPNICRLSSYVIAVDQNYPTPYGYWRDRMGILGCPGLSQNTFATINDSGYTRFGGNKAWCVGMAFSYLEYDPLCRGIDTAKVYEGGGSFAGYLDRDNVAAQYNVDPVYRSRMIYRQPLNDAMIPAYVPGVSNNIELKISAQNTNDGIPPGDVFYCAGAPPGKTWIFFADQVGCYPAGYEWDPYGQTQGLTQFYNNRMRNLKSSTLITFAMKTPKITRATCVGIEYSINKGAYFTLRNSSDPIYVTSGQPISVKMKMRNDSNYGSWSNIGTNPNKIGTSTTYTASGTQNTLEAGELRLDWTNGTYYIGQGQIADFTYVIPQNGTNVIAANSTYNFKFRMLQEGQFWFNRPGDTSCDFIITTLPPPGIPQCTVAPKDTIIEPGGVINFTVTVSNIQVAGGGSISGTINYSIDGTSGNSEVITIQAPPNPSSTSRDYSATISNSLGPHTITASFITTSFARVNCSGTLNVNAAYRPYVRFYGSDVSVGSPNTVDCPGWSVPGSISPNNGKIWAFNLESAGGYVGSGTQFGAMALSDITGFGSSGSSAKRLTFANTIPADPYGGNYGAAFCPPNYWDTANTTTLNLGDTLDINDASFPNGGYYNVPASATPLSINCGAPGGFTLNLPKTTKLYIDRDVRICNNIGYTSSWASVNEIPNLWIIARGNIYIDTSVTTMSGNFIAMPKDVNLTGASNGGYIYTCTVGGMPPTAVQVAQSCKTTLTVYGSLIAKTIKLFRSGGSVRDAAANETYLASKAAEIITTGPESWIAESLTNRGKSTSTFDAITSLPPIL